MAKVLVVDDVREHVLLLSSMLSSEGYEVCTAYDGEEALRATRSERPDLILLGILVPEFDGIEVCKQLQGDPRLRRIPIIIVSNLDTQEEIVEALDAGALGYVTKPFDMDVISAWVRSALRVKIAYDTVSAIARQLDDAKRKAERASQIKGEFLSNMSHEVRRPMNRLIGMTNLLLESGLPGELREYAEAVRGCGDALLELINDILGFSNIDASKLQLESIEFDLQGCVQDLYEVLDMRAQDRGLYLEMTVDADVPSRLKGDQARLRQVLLNLVNNAIKYTESGEVNVSVRLLNRRHNAVQLRFEVHDTGTGVPPEQVADLFGSAYDLEALPEGRPRATGLGLSICKEIVEFMGGEIGVESEPELGSTFWFEVSFEVAKSSEREAYVGLDIRRTRILVAETNPTSRIVLSDQLRAWDCQVTQTVNGPEVLQLLEGALGTPDEFDAALIEVASPELSGARLAQDICRDERFGKLRLMALITDAERQRGGELIAAGFDAYLVRPVNQVELHDAILFLLGDQFAVSGPPAY